MSNFSENSTNILIKWLRKAEIEVIEQKIPRYEELRLDIGKAMGAIYKLNKKPKVENVPQSDHFQVTEQWTDLMLNEFFPFNENGAEYICSISEATIKVTSLKNVLSHTSPHPMFFRGEHIFGWELISKLGRQHPDYLNNKNTQSVSELELKLLKKFQKKVKEDKELKNKIFGKSFMLLENGNVIVKNSKKLINKIFANNILADNDAGWWSIMQHYDEVNGTRLIDITSSLYSALYFACADWDGSVDEKNDGKLYMFPTPTGRTETSEPDMWKDQIVGSEDKIETEVKEYFNVPDDRNIPRFRISPIMNNRILSQDGYFMWQQYFDRKFNTDMFGNHFPFRIHRDYKKNIIKELESIGYTRERILAENRFDREAI